MRPPVVVMMRRCALVFALLVLMMALVRLSDASAAVRLAHVGDFNRPTYVTAPAGDSRLFVVQQPGQVKLIKGGVTSTFLDISREVHFDGGEQGLLSIAFAPGKLYAYYTSTNCPQAPGCDEHLSEFTVNGESADPVSEHVLLTIPHPTYPNHNGGQLQIGPDGALYISVGDGGGANDSERNGQRPDGLLGKILRLAPGSTTPTIWAYGLRNPWRFSFDGSTMWIGDVGQDSFEEIDHGQQGANYGWPCFEGFHANPAGAADECPPKTAVTAPVLDYPHPENCNGASFCGEGIIGGYVLHDPSLPTLDGCYVYGDLSTPRLRVAGLTAQKVLSDADLGPSVPSLSSFGTDAQGHLYAMSVAGGVWKLESDGNHATDPTCATARPLPPPPKPPPPRPDPPGNPLAGMHFFVDGPRHGVAAGEIAKLLHINPLRYPDNYPWAQFRRDLPGLEAHASATVRHEIYELSKIAAEPEGNRFWAFSAGGGPGKIFTQVYNFLNFTLTADPGSVPIVTTYFARPLTGNCPTAAQVRAVEPGFRRRVDEFVQGVGDHPVVLLLEIDAYGASGCMARRGSLGAFEDLIRYEVDQTAALPRATVYLEAGYHDSDSPAYAARALNRSDIGRIRGFFTNDTHFAWTADEVKWANAISKLTGGAHFVVNTAVNGNGPKLNRHPTTQGVEDLCDPVGRALGPRPTTKTGFSLADAWLWTKTPGYSNGCRRGSPPADTYWLARAVALASRANERLGSHDRWRHY